MVLNHVFPVRNVFKLALRRCKILSELLLVDRDVLVCFDQAFDLLFLPCQLEVQLLELGVHRFQFILSFLIVALRWGALTLELIKFAGQLLDLLYLIIVRLSSLFFKIFLAFLQNGKVFFKLVKFNFD